MRRGWAEIRALTRSFFVRLSSTPPLPLLVPQELEQRQKERTKEKEKEKKRRAKLRKKAEKEKAEQEARLQKVRRSNCTLVIALHTAHNFLPLACTEDKRYSRSKKNSRPRPRARNFVSVFVFSSSPTFEGMRPQGVDRCRCEACCCLRAAICDSIHIIDMSNDRRERRVDIVPWAVRNKPNTIFFKFIELSCAVCIYFFGGGLFPCWKDDPPPPIFDSWYYSTIVRPKYFQYCCPDGKIVPCTALVCWKTSGR